MKNLKSFRYNYLHISFDRTDKDGKFTAKLLPSGTDSIYIFSIVFDAIRQYLKSNGNVNHVGLCAANNEPSRVKLYSRLSNSASKFIPGLKLDKVVDDNEDTYYFLTPN